MESGTKLQQCADSTVHDDAPARRLDDAANDLEERRLAGAVFTNHAERLASCNFERDAVERAKNMLGAVAAQQIPNKPQPPAARIDLRVVFADVRQREEG